MTDTVITPNGQLRGRTDAATGVTAFMGIPFAAPPVGPLRWQPPQPAAKWDGVRDATKAAARCIQHAPYGELEADNPNMSEDCLYLNVWTPNARSDAKLPVLFWIHGGEFWAGSGTEARYNGAKLAARGAVVVTINHRLGVFGFLSHPELSAEGAHGTSGNYGLLDQIAALKWTRDNVAAFGGDPDNITVGGESAGSCSVSFLMASRLSRGLFHKALGESCAYFMPEPHGMKPLSHAENEQRGIDFMHAAGADSIAELRAMPAEHLLATWMKDMSKRMQPCFDDYVLPHVDQVFARGEQSHTPLLCGWNGDEYGFMRGAGDKFDLAGFQKRLEGSFEDDAATLQNAYGPLSLATATEITSDRLMVWPTWKWADEHARVASVYVYQFDRAAPGSPFGATHASELEYVFGALDSKPRDYAKEDRDLSERIGDHWISFARTGDPNWPQYNDGQQVMYLDAKDEVKPLQTRARLELLDRLFAKR
jgi:para-nitrobenzyl esterase